jgi:hypothetical protein
VIELKGTSHVATKLVSKLPDKAALTIYHVSDTLSSSGHPTILTIVYGWIVCQIKYPVYSAANGV